VSRALPYELAISDAVSALNFTLAVSNNGTAGTFLIGFDVAQLADVTPRKYGVSAGAAIRDTWPLPAGAPYFFAVHSANGFVRTFSGDVAASAGASLGLSAALTYAPVAGMVMLTLGNAGGGAVNISVTDNAYGGAPRALTLQAGSAGVVVPLNVTASGFWYDLSVDAAVGAAPSPSSPLLFHRRFMGRMETGADSISDPAMAAGVPGYVPTPHLAAGPEAWAAAVAEYERLGGAVAARHLAFGPDGRVVHPAVPEVARYFPRRLVAHHKDEVAPWTTVLDFAGEATGAE
jgi:phospholipase C